MEVEVETMKYIAEAAKYLSLSIMCLVMLAVAKGVASVFTTFITCVSRNPNVKKEVSGYTLIGAGMTEAIALYALGLAIMVLFQ